MPAYRLTPVSFQGCIAGSVAAILSVGAILVGSHMNKQSYPWLPVSTDNCDVAGLNSTLIHTPQITTSDDVHWIFRISFLYYSVLSCLIFTLVAVAVSHFTTDESDKSYETMDQRMLAPFRRNQKLYQKQMEQFQEKELKTLLPEPQEKLTKEECAA